MQTTQKDVYGRSLHMRDDEGDVIPSVGGHDDAVNVFGGGQERSEFTRQLIPAMPSYLSIQERTRTRIYQERMNLVGTGFRVAPDSDRKDTSIDTLRRAAACFIAR